MLEREDYSGINLTSRQSSLISLQLDGEFQKSHTSLFIY